PALSPDVLRSKCRRLKREHGLGLVVIDYLQLMQVPGNSENRATEISEISRSLKALAKELNVPVIALSQLNRSLETRTDKRPVMADLRESGAIEQDADIILFIYRDEYYNKENSPDKDLAEVIIGKHRSGPTGSVKLKFFGEHTRFDNLANDAGGSCEDPSVGSGPGDHCPFTGPGIRCRTQRPWPPHTHQGPVMNIRKQTLTLLGTAALVAAVAAGCQTTNPYTGEQQMSRTSKGALIGAGIGVAAGLLT